MLNKRVQLGKEKDHCSGVAFLKKKFDGIILPSWTVELSVVGKPRLIKEKWETKKEYWRHCETECNLIDFIGAHRWLFRKFLSLKYNAAQKRRISVKQRTRLWRNNKPLIINEKFSSSVVALQSTTYSAVITLAVMGAKKF